MTREDAYAFVQKSAMEVWTDANRNLKDELLNSQDVSKYLTANEIEELFNPDKLLKNLDYIFSRSVEKD